MKFCALLLACLLCADTLLGGPTTEVRREFQQSRTYPYIFRPVGYLMSAGPVPMRFSAPGPDCGRRTPPPAPVAPLAAAVPPSAEEEFTKTEEITPVAPPVEAPPVEGPPPPVQEEAPGENAPSAGTARPVLPSSTADFNRMPDEVLEYFRNPYDAPEGQYRYEDPIFRPARPEELPKSEATYTENK